MTKSLTVAVTGPTGTFGHGLLPLLQADDGIGSVIGVARRPFDPAELGWSKMSYQQGDVRDVDRLRSAFRGADVVVHLAFLVVGGSRESTRSVNVEGTLNAFRAAAAEGVTRFVYASSVAAYGFHPDNPTSMSEQWPVRPARTLFYAQEKAEIELLLQEEALLHPDLELYLLRPPVVVGPNAVGGKGPRLLQKTGLRRVPLPVPVVVPDFPLQVIHEDDVGTALLRCVLGQGPAGAYNIAADDVISVLDIARAFGLRPLGIGAGTSRRAARLVSRVPGLPSYLQWVEALAQPAIMDTARARSELGWTPKWGARDALRDMVT